MTVAAPILITGSHRSGTTWVGRTLAASPSVAYLHEPFHTHHDPGLFATQINRWFTYVCADNGAECESDVRDMLLRARSAEPHGRGGAPRIIRPLIKDPLAVFSAPWLASVFGARNVIMIRHPAAFAGSLKDRGWTHPFAHFLDQPLLMRDHLEPFAGDLMRFARDAPDVVDQAALLWQMIYATVLKYRDVFPAWIYVRHEDLARHPAVGFRALADRLALDFSPEIERAAAEGVAVDLGAWRTRLTREEIDRVRSRVSNVSRHFYSEAEW